MGQGFGLLSQKPETQNGRKWAFLKNGPKIKDIFNYRNLKVGVSGSNELLGLPMAEI
jgi:hypothetical protein